ncbi:unnamed protein product [Caenorhabditis brenneri]
MMVIPMIRLLLTALFVLYSVIAQDHLRKVSGDAAPEKAQEPIDDEFDDFIPTIDSSVQLLDNTIPEPPPLPIGLQFVPKTTGEPQAPASLPEASPPSAQVAPPAIRPPDEEPSSSSTSAAFSTGIPNTENSTTSIPYDDIQITVDTDDILPEPADDLEEFQKADLLEKEDKNDVKDLVKKTTINKTNDYYITSPATTVMSALQEDNVGEEEDVFDFDKLFDKKIAIKNSGTTDNTQSTEQTKTDTGTTFSMIMSTTPKTTTTTSLPSTTTRHMTTEAHRKTCIHVKDLQTVDDSVVVHAGVKKGTIEVSVELGEEQEDDGENSDDSSEEDDIPVRQVRENKHEIKKPVVWKKFVMNCDEEIDDKGKICKLWAAGGLCGTHKPTMFLFCRRTCLCVGPN